MDKKEYIEREVLIKDLTNNAGYKVECGYEKTVDLDGLIKYIKSLPTADVENVVRCRNCKFHHWEQEPCHGKTEHFCSVLKAQVFADFYCYHGKSKECER